MSARELAVPGAWEITPTVHRDARGLFFEWFTDREFATYSGHHFDLAQANVSVSAAGVLRGMHYAECPPSQAKYVTCLQGSVFDVVVDIRVGSPTFGRADTIILSSEKRNSVYVSEGLAHGFLSLEPQSTVMYLCSTNYNPEREHTIDAFDPELKIPWPALADESIRSERDADAPTLRAAIAEGTVPLWSDVREYIDTLRGYLPPE